MALFKHFPQISHANSTDGPCSCVKCDCKDDGDLKTFPDEKLADRLEDTLYAYSADEDEDESE